jgi:hypothetical protein
MEGRNTFDCFAGRVIESKRNVSGVKRILQPISSEMP